MHQKIRIPITVMGKVQSQKRNMFIDKLRVARISCWLSFERLANQEKQSGSSNWDSRCCWREMPITYDIRDIIRSIWKIYYKEDLSYPIHIFSRNFLYVSREIARFFNLGLIIIKMIVFDTKYTKWN